METTKKPLLHVIAVCPGIGFPAGQANTNRLCHIGKTIIEGGGRFTVWHFGTSPNTLNTHKKGVYEGIRFHYLSVRVQRPANAVVRHLIHLTGIVHLFFKILFQVTGRSNTVVFLDLQKTSLNIFLAPFCRMLGIKTVQEVNEWWPEVDNTSSLVKFLYRNIMFRFSQGSLLISGSYRQKIMQTTSYHPQHKFFYLPVLAEPLTKEIVLNGQVALSPYVFWCGMVDGYSKDVLFLIQSFRNVRAHHPAARLVIGGKYSEATKHRLYEELRLQNLPESCFKLTGFISNDDLLKYVHGAAVLVVPMWDDERSETRFPTKLGLFAFAGKGIVTAPVGELKEYFRNEDNCLFYRPGDAGSLAEKINRLLADSKEAAQLGQEAKRLAEKTFSYKNYIGSMQAFFARL